MDQAVSSILDLAGKLTVVGILFLDLVVVAVGAMRKWYVFGWQYAERVQGEKDWKEAFFRSTDLARRNAEVASTVLTPDSREGAAR